MKFAAMITVFFFFLWHNQSRQGSKEIGVRLGNWLSGEEARALWQFPNAETLKGKRDQVILATLLGCGLRRREGVKLTLDRLQRREGCWVIVVVWLARLDTFGPSSSQRG